MRFQKLQTIFLFLSLVLMGLSAFSIGFFGLPFGIEFTGGSLLEVEYREERPPLSEIRESVSGLDLGTLVIQPTDEKGALFRMKDISEETHQQMLSQLGDLPAGRQDAEELRFESIGPTIGQELRDQALSLSLFSIGAVVLYIAFAFRRTIGGLRPWHWSGAALIASLHDVLLPVGIFAVLGQIQGVQLTIPVLVALLTTIGYSINDKVVVFDRIRENLAKHVGFDFADTVKQALKQTWFRSLSTSATTLVVLLAVFLFGGTTLKEFSLMLMIGVAVGTWSSLFVAPRLLMAWRKNVV